MAGLFLLALGLLLPGGAWAQEGADTFADSTSVLVVEVPVQVVDRDGNPIRGLTRENFEIREGRKQQDVLYFDVFDTASVTAADRQQLAPAARRHFLLLFDLSFADAGSILRAREAAQGILDDLHDTDLVAVGTVSVTRGSELVLAFTPDRKAAELAIETLGAPQLVDRGAEPLGVALAGMSGGSETTAAGEGGVTGGGSGGGGAAGPDAKGFQDAIEDYVRSIVDTVNRSDRDAQIGRIQGMTRSMAQLANLMRAVDGRKHVIYLSEGFDSRLLTGNEGGLDQQRTTSGNIESGTLWEVDTDEMFGSGRLQNVLERTLEEFRRADCAIHAVDIGGLDGSAGAGRDGLVAMARGTGGEMYQNFNDLGEAMNRMLDATSVTYLLGFQPEGLAADGAYRKLDVRLRDAPGRTLPRGAKLVHRPGYYAPLPAGQRRSAEEERLSVASQLVAGKVGGAIGIDVLAVPFPGPRGPSGLPAVPVVIEMDGKGLAASATDGKAALEVYAYALDGDGSVRDSFFQTLGLDLAQVGQRLEDGGVKFYGQLALPPGDYNLRVLVRNPLSGASGLASLGLSVHDFARGGLAVLPPLVPEMDLERWLMVRQAPVEGRETIEYPFVLGEGQSFIPSAAPVIRTGEAVNLGLFAYNVSAGEPVLNAQVINAAGDVVLGQQLPVLERRGGGEGEPTRLLSALQLSAIAPGDYTLAVGLMDREGGERGLGTLPIRVETGVPGSGQAIAVGTGIPVSPGSGVPVDQAGGAAEGASAPVIRGRDSQRFPALKAAYQRALGQLAAGEEAAARDALLALEEGERRAAKDDVRLTVLHDAQSEAAEQLASRNPDALIPVMLLHEAIYHAYRERQQPLLALHHRTMVRELAELYVKEGGSPTSLAASVFTSLGGSLQQAGLTRAANSLFERALDLRQNDRGALLSLAVYYEKVGQYDSAVRYLKRLVEAHPDSPEGWLRLGINLEREGNKDAETWLRRASGTEAPPWVRSLAYQERARRAMDAGRLEEAERVLSEGNTEVPGDQHLILLLTHVLDRRGKGRNALSLLDNVHPAPPGVEDSPRYRYNRWPIHVLETGRQQLRETAVERLPLLAGVIRNLPESEWSR